jgi:hypothetical protein
MIQIQIQFNNSLIATAYIALSWFWSIKPTNKLKIAESQSHNSPSELKIPLIKYLHLFNETHIDDSDR